MSHREWNPRSFFRHLSRDGLEALRGWSQGALAPRGLGPLWERTYRTWKALPEAQRQTLERALAPVNALCVPDARARLEVLAAQLWAGTAQLKACRYLSAQDLAVQLFVQAPEAFAQLHQAWAVDALEHVKEYVGRASASPRTDGEAKAALHAALRAHLKQTAYGERCRVEDFASAEKFALFVFHEDEVEPTDRFTRDDALQPVWERAVVKLAAVYHFESNVLTVKAPRKAEREALRDLFAKHIVGDADFFEDAARSHRFSFAPLDDVRFDFPALPGSKLLGARLQRVVVRPAAGDVRRLSAEFLQPLTVAAAHDALEGCGVDLRRDTLEGVQLRVEFEGNGRSRTRTVSLCNPNSSNLSDTPRDRVIRRHLRVWGFDASAKAAPQPPRSAAHREETAVAH